MNWKGQKDDKDSKNYEWISGFKLIWYFGKTSLITFRKNSRDVNEFRRITNRKRSIFRVISRILKWNKHCFSWHEKLCWKFLDWSADYLRWFLIWNFFEFVDSFPFLIFWIGRNITVQYDWKDLLCLFLILRILCSTNNSNSMKKLNSIQFLLFGTFEKFRLHILLMHQNLPII